MSPAGNKSKKLTKYISNYLFIKGLFSKLFKRVGAFKR